MNDRIGEKLERWLAGDTSVEFDDFERDVLSDSELADEIYAAVELAEALSEAADQGILESHPQRVLLPQHWAWATGLVAAMLAFFLLLPQFQEPGGDLPPRLRSAGDTGSAVGYEPLGELTHFPRYFSWHPANPSLDSRFRWELYDAQARRRGIAVVADSTLVRDASMAPADSIGTWLWLVIELKPDGQEGPTSAAVKFTVKPKGNE